MAVSFTHTTTPTTVPIGHEQIAHTTTIASVGTTTGTCTATSAVVIRTDCTKITDQSTGGLLAVAALDEVQLDLAGRGRRHVPELFVERRNGRRTSGRRVEVLLPVVDPLAQHLVQRLKGRHLRVEVGTGGAVVVVVVVHRRVVTVLIGGR